MTQLTKNYSSMKSNSSINSTRRKHDALARVQSRELTQKQELPAGIGETIEPGRERIVGPFKIALVRVTSRRKNADLAVRVCDAETGDVFFRLYGTNAIALERFAKLGEKSINEHIRRLALRAIEIEHLNSEVEMMIGRKMFTTKLDERGIATSPELRAEIRSKINRSDLQDL